MQFLPGFHLVTIYFRKVAICFAILITDNLSRYRLVADKINKNERKNKYEILNVTMGQEDDDFWSSLNGQPTGKLMVSDGVITELTRIT